MRKWTRQNSSCPSRNASRITHYGARSGSVRTDLARIGDTKGTRVKVVAAAMLALLVPQEKNEAEELFRKMEKKLAEAKSLRMKVAVTVDSDKPTHRGELLFGGKNL